MPFQKGNKISVGRKHSLQTRMKMSLSHKSFKHTEESKEKIRNYLKGRKRVPFSDQAKLNMSKGQKGKKMSLATRQKMSIATSGKNNHFWKGGITSINLRIRQSLEYRLWRKAVYERDGYRCIWCGYIGDKLQADHIKSFCDYPELRFDVMNGRTLCIDCHKKTPTYGRNSYTYRNKWTIS